MSFIRSFVHIFLFFASTLIAQAVTLDWDDTTNVNWTPGDLSAHSFNVDGVAGNDITVAISGSTARLQQELGAGNPQTPAITKDFQGGLGSTQNTLGIALDLAPVAGQPVTTEAIVVTITLAAAYTQGVTNVSFSLFDIDFSNASGNTYQDKVSAISATSIDGITQIAPTITTSANNTVSGTGLNQVVLGTASTVDTGAGSGNGNVTISFGANAIRSFTFTYGGGTFNNPTYQHMGIFDITFTPVPEINPAWSSILSCFAAAGLLLRHRAKFRK